MASVYTAAVEALKQNWNGTAIVLKVPRKVWTVWTRNLHLWHIGVAAVVKMVIIPSGAATVAKPSPIALAWDPLDNLIWAEPSTTWFTQRWQDFGLGDLNRALQFCTFNYRKNKEKKNQPLRLWVGFLFTDFKKPTISGFHVSCIKERQNGSSTGQLWASLMSHAWSWALEDNASHRELSEVLSRCPWVWKWGLGSLRHRDIGPPCLQREGFGEVLLQGTVRLSETFVSASPVVL